MNLQTKFQKARAEAEAYKDALHAALVALAELAAPGQPQAAAALQKLIVGYPPAKHTGLMWLPPGKIYVDHTDGTWLLVRREEAKKGRRR